MTIPQPGIFAIGTKAHHHLQFALRGEPGDLLERIGAIRDGNGTVAGANIVVGFSPTLTERLWPGQVPTGLTDFEPIVGDGGYTMPAAQHDLWIWLHGASEDAMLVVARQAVETLAGVADLVAEEQPFVYRTSLDLTGFEDGTENPPIDEAIGAAVVPDGEPGAYGSVALLQRWEHDLAGFEALSPRDQELVFGRTLADNAELDDLDDHPSAHIARVVIEDDDGDELEVFRRSAPFGGVRVNGLMFLAFSADRARLQTMLERMAGVDGIRDRITDFSTPTDSAWYYVPPIDLLH
ncbi:MAG: Dyp-type peroxidase [Ilumatobacter sp.]|nr:Dyp-type peroxidase [Ilumatobacter sp.]